MENPAKPGSQAEGSADQNGKRVWVAQLEGATDPYLEENPRAGLQEDGLSRLHGKYPETGLKQIDGRFPLRGLLARHDFRVARDPTKGIPLRKDLHNLLVSTRGETKYNAGGSRERRTFPHE